MRRDRFETKLPTPPRPGIVWCAFLIFLFVGSPLLAVDNIRHWAGAVDVIALVSIVWLAMWALMVASSLPLIPGEFHTFLGSWSDDHFIALDHDDCVVSGFRIGGLELLLFATPVSEIREIEVRAGQASSLAGHDMDDWHIVVWETDNLHLVGPEQTRTQAMASGLEFRAHLEDMGWSPREVG